MKESTFEADLPDAAGEGSAQASRAAAAPILVAVDLSDDCEAALAWACDHAASIGAPLEIVHVVHDPADAPGSYRADARDPLEPNTDVARRKLTSLVERQSRALPQRQGVESATLHCVEGLPAAKILEVAQARGARLLVLGGGRQNGIARFVHGSTAQKVARQSRIPVTLVKAGG